MIAEIITEGFGSFGSIAGVVTEGYSSGGPVVVMDDVNPLTFLYTVPETF